ncbi:hypothetical protein HK104_003136 [Borealophlyctis nickersoniae]|nr:hypothetical protein HK104_003136 [Borealophlyctis nickersoniae]
MAMVEPVADTTGLPQSAGFGLPKVEVLASEYEDTGAATFVIRDEDHTLGNSLRYMIMKK